MATLLEPGLNTPRTPPPKPPSEAQGRARPSLSPLYRLFWVRNMVLLAQASALALARWVWSLELPWVALSLVLMTLGVVNLFTLLRLRRGGGDRPLEWWAHGLVDVLGLTGLLYLSGGSTNPFTAFYLLPIVLAAVTLPRHLAWSLAGLSVAAYTTLLFWYWPIPHQHHAHALMMHLHVFGMWLTFLLSAGLITYFVVGGRSRDLALAQLREQALRNERIVALGTQAAGAAHELGTPLTTMAVLARELEQAHQHDPDLGEDLRTLRCQIESCKATISRLLASAGQERLEAAQCLPVTVLAESALAQWRLLRPGADASLSCPQNGFGPSVLVDTSLQQALVSLLNNAADASPDAVTLRVHWTGTEACLEVLDRGPGVPPDRLAQLGQEVLSTKGAEHGLGLMLARAAVERLGGSLRLHNRSPGLGCRMLLPLAQAMAPSSPPLLASGA